MSVEKKLFGTFGSHVYNGGVDGKITGEVTDLDGEDKFWQYNLRIGVSNFAAGGDFTVNIQDPKMVDQMIAALQKLKEHMANNKVAAYI